MKSLCLALALVLIPVTSSSGRFQTTPALRSSMERIREIQTEAREAVTKAHRLAPRYGSQLQAEVREIIRTCRLAPEPDRALHEVILPILDGAKSLENKDTAKAALKAAVNRIDEALALYGRTFEHPGW